MAPHRVPRGRHASQLTDEERFWLRVEKTESCWLWRDPTAAIRYGKFKRGDGTQVGAHRFAYELLVGPIPEGLQLDHLCRVIACVNPQHLEPVSGRANKLRGETVNALRAAQASCINGHLFDVDNTLVTRTGRRACRACNRIKNREYRARKKASA